MKAIEKISSVYFLGIGGIGMSALARYFKQEGKRVSGYDKTPTVLTGKLQTEGINVHFEDDISLIDKEADIVVYTPAVPSDHKEYNYFKENGYAVLKRSDVLGMITKDSFNICVAGTHGKTTTSAMIAHVLRHSGVGCNAFLGGIASNYGTNFWSDELSTGSRDGKRFAVAEADEYDRSFLKLFPDVAVITAMDADHLDIYGTAEKLEEAFIAFAGNIRPGGLLLSKFGLKRYADLIAPGKMSYHLNDDSADAYGVDIKIERGSYHFDVMINGKKISGIELNMGGMHNIENAVAAITVTKHLGLEEEKIKAAVAAFRGVKRRFEYIIKNDKRIMIDDYAHHPEELRALITGAKELFPGKKCTVVFQPHLFSRTRDFADGFAEVLGIADEVILLPIYPARENPIEGVSSEMILSRMKNSQVKVLDKDAVLAEIQKRQPEFLITAGAGDIDMMIETIKNMLI